MDKVKVVKTLEEKRAAKALAMRKYRAKIKEKDPEGFLAKQRYEKQQQRAKNKGKKAPALHADLPSEFYPAPPVPAFKVPPPPKTPKPKKTKIGIPPPPPRPKPPPNKPKKAKNGIPPPPKTPKPKKAKIGIPPPPPNKPKKPKPPPNKPKKKITPVPKLKNISKKLQDDMNLYNYVINKIL